MSRSARTVDRLAALTLLVGGAAAQEVVWERPVGAWMPAQNSTLARLAVLEGGGVAALHGQLSGHPTLFRLDGRGEVTSTSTAPFGSEAPRMESVPSPDGGLFLVGQFAGLGLSSPPIGDADGVLAKVTPAGDVAYVRRFGEPGTYVLPTRAVPDGAGGLVVGGWALANFPSTSPGIGPAWLMRLDALGNELWRLTLPTTPDAGAGVRALSVDALGDLWVGGRFDGSTTAFHARVRMDGTLQWQAVLGPGSGLVLELVGLAGGRSVELRDPVPGPIECVLRDANGTPLGSIAFAGGAAVPSQLIGLPNGDFLVAGVVSGPGGSDARFERYAPNGALVGAFGLASAGQVVHELTDLVERHGSVYYAADMTLANGLRREVLGRLALEAFGAAGCAGRPNSTGAPAETRALGSDLRGDDALTLFTTGLPTPNAWGFYLGSRTTGFVPNAGGSRGDLCLGGAIGRFARNGEVVTSGEVGRFHLLVDLDDVPTPTGAISAAAGETWHFQAWYRDNDPSATSNLSSSVSVTLR